MHRAKSLFSKLALMAAILLATGVSLPMGHGVSKAYAQQQDRQAMLMPGKKTLFRRIVTKPGGKLYAKPGRTARVINPKVPAFAVYYVYGEENGFTEVGVNSHGGAKGWIETEKVVDWKQSIVVAFNNRAAAGRVRHVFYETIDTLSEELDATANPEAFADSANVIAMEPENAINDTSNFYLLPILDHESSYFPDDNEGNLLEVASITKQQPKRVEQDFHAGIVFVIDTTTSMRPYIRQTKEVIEQISVEIENSELSGKVSFGLVGFRQSEMTNPGIGYHVKALLPLTTNSSVEDFLTAIDQMDVARVPTQGFREDSIGGIAYAKSAFDWKPYSAKYIILVTDAGPRAPGEGDNYIDALDIPELAGDLADDQIRLLVMHLKTAAGHKDHQSAEARYRTASRLVGSVNDLYTDIRDGDVGAFGASVGTFAQKIIATSEAIREDKEIAAPDEADNSTEANLQRAARAFQLEFRGNREGDEAPIFYKAWTIDHAFGAYGRQALDIRLMLTKNQLSTMAGNLEAIVERANRPGGIIDANAFFQDIQDLALQASNDPNQVREEQKLGDAIAEYLEDLPYKSQTTAMTMSDWVTLSGPEQRDLMNSLESKLRYYQRVHDNPDKWVALHLDAAAGEYVTTISLDRMP
ncbi:vWA domain-containing protein [Cohaesibacter intestini]|uniref:vWA domain-containing protein n=1 Tax=Cohaesibacter intestini TaxID=2211145 RepID=UPI000DEA1798|nr:vWA domain-containing protein [Cohaesibacter intestini]